MRKPINLNTREGRNLFYQGPEWRALRIMILSENPYCVECLKDGIYEIATEVDHIIDITDDSSKFMDRDNLQSLCKSCHSRKTFKEHRSFQKQSFSVENKKWKIK
jgi:5-methylcytosine-specific restriction endonuclease McrA